MMKWLVPLSVFQTLLLVMLGLHAIKLDMRTDELVDSVDALNKDLQLASSGAAPIEWASAPPAGASLTADDIRTIIREEHEAIAAEGGAATPARSAATSSSSPQQPAPVYDQRQTVLTQSAIDQEMERLSSMNMVPPADMMSLQAKIAELPPEARRAALIRLTKAINSGEIKGQF